MVPWRVVGVVREKAMAFDMAVRSRRRPRFFVRWRFGRDIF